MSELLKKEDCDLLYNLSGVEKKVFVEASDALEKGHKKMLGEVPRYEIQNEHTLNTSLIGNFPCLYDNHFGCENSDIQHTRSVSCLRLSGFIRAFIDGLKLLIILRLFYHV